MLKKFFIFLLVVIGLVIIAGLFIPGDYSFDRSIVIHAPVEKIHALVGDLERWDDWAPWKDMSPDTKVTYGDKTTGVGAHQSWTSEDGNGELTFTHWDPVTGIEYDMDFEGMKSHCAIRYVKEGEAVRVVWSMTGNFNDAPVVGGYFAKLMSPVVGEAFEVGLAGLRDAAEEK